MYIILYQITNIDHIRVSGTEAQSVNLSLKCHYAASTKCYRLFSFENVEKKEGDLTQSYEKSPYTNRNVKRAKCQKDKDRHKKFDYTAVADRLRTVSSSTYGHPTGVVNLVYGPNLPTPRNSRVIKRTHV